MIKKIIICFTLLFVIAPSFALSQSITQPENFDQAKELGNKALEVTKTQGSTIIKNVWEKDALPIWKKMLNWLQTNIWDNHLKPWLGNIWESTLRILKIEVSQRKPGVQEEFQNKKQAVRQEAPVLGKSLWQKFQNLIK
jgi:hypothetical protein